MNIKTQVNGSGTAKHTIFDKHSRQIDIYEDGDMLLIKFSENGKELSRQLDKTILLKLLTNQYVLN
jgi:hypothetical protein